MIAQKVEKKRQENRYARKQAIFGLKKSVPLRFLWDFFYNAEVYNRACMQMSTFQQNIIIKYDRTCIKSTETNKTDPSSGNWLKSDRFQLEGKEKSSVEEK